MDQHAQTSTKIIAATLGIMNGSVSNNYFVACFIQRRELFQGGTTVVVEAEWDSKLPLMHEVTLQGHTSGRGERTQVSQISLNPVPGC